MAVPGQELRVRAGDDEAGRRAVPPAGGADLLAGQLDPDGWADAGDGGRWKQPNISSLSRGRRKLGADPVRMLFEQAAGPTGAEGAPGVFCCGLRVISMDGSVTDVPDSRENDTFFGRPSNQSRDGAFPQARWVAAAESGTGSLLGASIGPYRSAEQSLALDLLHCFGLGMLVLADRKFLSWSLARAFLATGAHILWRASASFALMPVKVLADGTYLAELKPPRKSDGPVITVRVIEYTVHTVPEDGTGEESSEVFCLVTDLLNTEEYPALDLACCYPDRWGCETVIGRHKTDMGEGQPVLRSKDPEGVMQEMWALFAVYQAICRLHRHRRERGGHSPGTDQLPVRPGRRDRHRRGFPPLTSSISRSPRSCSRSSSPAPPSEAAQTVQAPARPRKPATSPPGDPVSPASPTSPAESSSTCSTHGRSPKSKAVGLLPGSMPTSGLARDALLDTGRIPVTVVAAADTGPLGAPPARWA